ncbi:MAG: tetratricopeptide repeat protein, partial [Elusimicrobiota bacterium]
AAANLDERDALLEEIRDLSGSKADAPKADEVAAWKAAVLEAIAAAAEPADMEKAFIAYAKALAKVPISFKAMQPLASAKVAIQRRVLDLHPAMGEEPQWKGQWPGSMKTGALVEAVLMEQHNTMAWSDAERDMVPQSAKPEEVARIRKLASFIDTTEKTKTKLLWTATQAFHQLRKDRLQESAALWRKVLAAEPSNAEAKFYLGRVERSISLGKPKTASVYARTEKEAAIDWSVTAPSRERAAEPSPKAARARRPTPKPAAAPAPRLKEPHADPAPAKRQAAVDPAIMREWGQDLYRRGLKAYSLGKLDEAIEYWNNCLGVDPDHPKARKALERAQRERK